MARRCDTGGNRESRRWSGVAVVVVDLAAVVDHHLLASVVASVVVVVAGFRTECHHHFRLPMLRFLLHCVPPLRLGELYVERKVQLVVGSFARDECSTPKPRLRRRAAHHGRVARRQAYRSFWTIQTTFPPCFADVLLQHCGQKILALDVCWLLS